MRLLVRHGRTVIVAFCLLGVGMATLALGGSPGRAATRDGGLHLVVVPRSTDAQAALADSAARRIAGYDAFTLVEATAADTDRLVAAGADVRDDMREVRIGERRAPIRRSARPSLLDKTGAAPGGAPATGGTRPRRRAVRRAAQGRVGRRGAQDRRRGRHLHGPERAARERRRRRARARSPDSSPTAVHPRGDAVHRRRQAPARPARRRPGGGRRAPPSPASAATPRAPRVARRRDAARRRGDRSRASSSSASALDAAGLDALGRARRRGRDRAVRRRRSCSTSAPRMIVAGNLNAELPAGARRGLPQLPAQPRASPTDSSDRRRHHRRGRRQGRRAGARRLAPGLLPLGSAGEPEPHRLRAGGHRRRRRRARLRRPRHQRRLDRDRLQLATGAAVEDAQGFNYGLGVAPVRAARRDEDLQLRRQLRRHDVAHGAAQRRLRAAARASPTTRGARPSTAPTTPIAQEFDALVRDAQPGVAGNQQFTEVFAAGNAGPGPNTIGAPGTAKNVITVGASENVRADRRHGRLRRHRRRREQRPRHHRLLQPRADRRRPHQARRRRAGHPRRPARSRRPGASYNGPAPATRSSRPAARSTRWSRAPRRRRRRSPASPR